jgi:Protein of unknown function (DUF669)
MPINLDFTGVEASQFDAHAAGWYDGTIFEVDARTASTGNPMLVVRYQFEDPETGGKFSVYENYVLVPQSMFKLKNLLLALGVPSEEITGKFKLDERQLLGKEISALLTVTKRQDTGENQNRVNKVVLRQNRPDEQVPASGF